MRKLLLFPLLLLMSIMGSCQTGPTVHKVVLTFTQSTTAGITGNCLYRGSATGTYALPALQCSTGPVTTFTDTSVTPGANLHYAVTAQTGSGSTLQESQYSNDAAATIPASPNAPTLNPPATSTLSLPSGPNRFTVDAKDTVVMLNPAILTVGQLKAEYK